MGFDFADVFETMWGSDPAGGKAEVVTANLRAVGEESGVDARDVEIIGHAPLVYRPAPPTKEGRCQALTVRFGGRTFILGTQDSRSNEATGALGEGDVALCSPTGKNVLRLNATGEAGIALVQQTDGDDAGIAIQRDGKILIYNEWGVLEIGPDGFFVTVKDKGQIQLDDGGAALIAKRVGLGPAPSKPLCTGAGAAAVPIPYLLG